jgi:hypothetical protein
VGRGVASPARHWRTPRRTAWRGTLADLSRGKHRHGFASLPRLVCDESISSLLSFRPSHCHEGAFRSCPYSHPVVGLSTSQQNSLTAGSWTGHFTPTYLKHTPSTWQPGPSTDVVGLVDFSSSSKLIDDYYNELLFHSKRLM